MAVALLDPYASSGIDVTPLAKILPALPAAAAEADAVVIRVADEVPSEDFEEIAIALSSQRRKPVELAVLRPSASGSMICSHTAGASLGVDRFMAELRELEFHAQLHRTGAVFQPANAHFVLPSGAHASEYIRVADMFDDYVAVRRAVDWLQERVTPDSILVADTWTILPVLQEMRARALEHLQSELPVLCFRSYPEPEEVRQTLRRVSSLAASRSEAKALFVLSMASSGTMLDNLRKLTERYMRGVQTEVVAIVNADRSIDVECLCVVDNIQRFSESNCKLCRSSDRRPTILIDRKRYFPAISVERVPVMITPKFATAHREFWELADRQRAVRLHAAVTQGSPLTERRASESILTPVIPIKHRDIAIDIRRLLDSSSFKDSLCDALAKFQPRSDLVVVPSHGVSDELLSIARTIYPSPETITLEQASRSDLKNKLRGKRRILILDDAVVSGGTVRSIHRMIQDILHELPQPERAADYTISAFVVIGRPETEGLWNRLHDSLRQGSGRDYLSCYVKLLLPDGGCPWCDERARLKRAQSQRAKPVFASDIVAGQSQVEAEVDRFIRERLRKLNPPADGSITGLSDSIFMCGPDGESSSDDTLTSHSLFGEALHEVTAYAAVAAAMHSIRVEQNRKLQGQQGVSWHWDVARIITAYHDPIIQASFLRAAQPHELLLENQADLDDAVREAFYMTDDPNRQVSLMLAAEHKWAAIAQKHASRARLAFTAKADEVIARHIGGDHPIAAEKLRQAFQGLEAELLLSAR